MTPPWQFATVALLNARARERELRRMARATTGQVAEALGVSVVTVRKWIYQGLLTASFGKGHIARIRWRAVSRALRHPQVQLAVGHAIKDARGRAEYRAKYCNQDSGQQDEQPREYPREYVPASPPAGPSSDD